MSISFSEYTDQKRAFLKGDLVIDLDGLLAISGRLCIRRIYDIEPRVCLELCRLDGLAPSPLSFQQGGVIVHASVLPADQEPEPLEGLFLDAHRPLPYR